MRKYYYGFRYEYWPPKRDPENDRVLGVLHCFPDLDKQRKWLAVENGGHRVPIGRKAAILLVGREVVEELRGFTAEKYEVQNV